MRGLARISVAVTALLLVLPAQALAEVQRAEGPVAESWLSGSASVAADKFEASRASVAYRLGGTASADHRVRIVFWACGPVSCDAVKTIETDVRRGAFDRSWRVGVETTRRDRLQQLFVEVEDLTTGGYVGSTLGVAFAT